MPSQPFPLVCLPFAGSGAGFYRAWTEGPDRGIKVIPVQLPGREELFLDTPFTDALEAAAQLAPQIAELTAEFPAFGLFGHSLGAVLCYEIARELQRLGHPGPSHLYVSGSPGPWNGRDSRATGLNDEEFLERVQEFAGYRHAAFDNPDLRELLLPVLRADVAMHENYKPSSDEPLGLPVTSIRGETDALVSREHAQQWRDVTRDAFRYVELPGGHMYLADAAEALLRTIAER
ncbi:pyochelin biosynthetic protein PchC [Streptomyces himastatinicus ATCC 53653]|uniref:Putative thioesterase n=1 Tax=Streptomyces himastatinicus ATCC 53653 TaxID=457427 RepID=D9WMP6_9ACTN|nr:alpha/beta fold hydrolase [Streptomyces himastatinicus]EFL27912.1 pyochelin biosynthetic protein PchC [Streptomyces himastatinicus ATCC 53653]CBZ42142.1 putative thioesterase [Streptomyces himastatinicus ATCC 53653]